MADPGWLARRPTLTELAVEAEGLVKRYGDTIALDGLDLQVRRGTVLGLLGPNGAGKTTAVRIFATLLPQDAGTARVAGHDVRTAGAEVRRRIGLTGQYAAVDEHLSGTENLLMIGRLNGFTIPDARDRAGRLLERFGLADAADRPSRTYSGGMRRRLDLAASLVSRPDVLFLDEPTTGLDPASRLSLWSVIREIIADGTTVLLTTQYLEEADALVDEIVVIDHGATIASGTADQLKAQVGGAHVEVRVDPAAVASAAAALRPVAGTELTIDEGRGQLAFAASTDDDVLPATVRALDAADVAIHDLSRRRASLDDVFLALTGRSAEGTTESMQEAT